MNNILITGANGFIGSHLAEEAESRGMQVYAGVRKSSNLTFLQHTSCKLFYIDLSNKQELIRGLTKQLNEEGGFRYIIHNAGLTQNKVEKNFNAINYSFTQNLAEALIASGNIPEKFIYTSSISATGPAPTNRKYMLNDNKTDQPVTPYGESKRKAEQFLMNAPFPVVIFRVPPAYGPREKNMVSAFRMVKKGIMPVMGYADQYLSMIYIKDLAAFFMQALEHPIRDTRYLISDGANYPQKRVTEAIARAIGNKPIRLRIPLIGIRAAIGVLSVQSALSGKSNILNHQKYKEIAPRNWQINASRAMEELKYVPQYKLQDGINATYQWYLAHHWL